MSPVFRHGRLRLYLLKLLDESPRHGYEVIRLLQDRFMGVYAPSPGTIYPRLARLEEEGLVTHDEVDGKKVYRITDKGRQELHARLDDLAELEEEITASVRDIAREVSEDVRETVRSLREELTWAAREFHARARQETGDPDQGPAESARQARERTQRQHDEAHRQRDRALDEARRQRDEARRMRDEARRERDAARGRGGAARDAGESGRDQWGEDAGRDQRHERDWWRERGGRHWGGTAWGDKDWGDWASWGGWPAGAGPHGCGDPRAYRDLERLAKQFSRELRQAAWQAQAISEDAVHDVRGILEDTIGRIRTEVFHATAAHQPKEPSEATAAHHSPEEPSDPGDTPGAPPTDAPAE
jgi:DNA-binding PadR family transcriptional regulator